MRFLESWLGMVAILFACWVYVSVLLYGARLFFPSNEKAKSIAFVVALLSIVMAYALLGGSPGDPSERWRR
jgi:hypothetical protein